MQAHLEGLGLTGEQIEFVVGLSRRVMAAREDSRRGRDDGMWRRVEGALFEAGIEHEKIRDVMDAMRKIMGEIKAEGNAFELDPAMFEDELPNYANTRSPRVAAGLGTIARVVANGADIYRAKLSVREALERIRT